MRAVGEGLAEPPPHQLPRAGEQPVERILEDRDAEALDHLLDAPDAELHARHQRLHVAEALLRIARVAVEDRERRLVGDAFGDQLRRRDDDALVHDVGRIGADRAGAEAADIGEMRPGHHECDAAPVVEDRRDQHLVVGMRDGAARAVAVVVPVDVAGLHAVRGEAPEHRPHHVAEDRHHGADGHHAVAVEQAGVEILLLADEGGDGGALDQRLHLALRRADRAADDLQDDRILDRPAAARLFAFPGFQRLRPRFSLNRM